MNTIVNSGIKETKKFSIGLALNAFKTERHPKIIFQSNSLNIDLLNNTKRNFSVTPQNLNKSNDFVPFTIKKNLKYNVYEGKNPIPYPFKFYYLKPENSNNAVVSLLSPEEINGKTMKKEGIVGWVHFENEEPPILKPWLFVENKDFYNLFNGVIKKNLHTDINKKVQLDAHFHKNGWMYFKDDRNKSNHGMLESAEDTFGAVEVKECEIIPKSFEPMFTYRILTRRGLFQLPEALHNKLVQEIQEKCLE
ncbi:hypothetical protein BCR32DRAFT_290819 [Anaeromyces robustus]|uniref:Uncharacterized protein n=1 Tax=Anaeromyces robustus TaxID=1754192 RepID=A0A1Y1XHP2_9FUNG|nr:hypothetical protein BCR32DRAFT_290819 [Anaeromyces robustus]|eukprot:ORX85263.1 hypothetical protein BCR32DRAFT_290819 [Anaeromyces robustus]